MPGVASRSPASHSGDFDDPLVVILLGVLAEVPHRAEVVLSVEGQLDLLGLPFGEVPVPSHHRTDTVDHLGQVGHCELDGARHLFAIVEGVTLPEKLGAGVHGKVRIGDLSGIV